MEFREISDEEWDIIRLLLPPRSRVGGPRSDDRMVLNGILYVLVTGCRCMDMPTRYGSYKTAWKRLKRWQDEDVWDRIFKMLVSIRSYGRVSIARQLRLRKGELIGYDGFKYKKGSKIHACVDGDSMPLNIAIGPGDEHDSRKLVELVEGLWEKPRELYADSAYNIEGIRRYLESIGVEGNIPVNPRNGSKPIDHTSLSYIGGRGLL